MNNIRRLAYELYKTEFIHKTSLKTKFNYIRNNYDPNANRVCGLKDIIAKCPSYAEFMQKYYADENHMQDLLGEELFKEYANDITRINNAVKCKDCEYLHIGYSKTEKYMAECKCMKKSEKGKQITFHMDTASERGLTRAKQQIENQKTAPFWCPIRKEPEK